MPEDALDQRVIDPLVISRLVGRSEAIAQNRNVALRPVGPALRRTVMLSAIAVLSFGPQQIRART